MTRYLVLRHVLRLARVGLYFSIRFGENNPAMRHRSLELEFASLWEQRKAEYASLDWRSQINREIEDKEYVANSGPMFENLVKEIEPTATLVASGLRLIVTTGKYVEDIIVIYKSRYTSITDYDIAYAWMMAHMALGTQPRVKPALKELL